MNHFLVEPESVGPGSITIDGPDAHHIRDVLRLKIDSTITVSAGEKGSFLCSIANVEKDVIRVEIIEDLKQMEPAPIKIILAQALPKGRKMDDIVRMACEMGAYQIIPVISGRCVVKIDDGDIHNKLKRWSRIAKAAAKQSRAGALTRISAPIDIAKLPMTIQTELNIVLWEEEPKTLKSVLTGYRAPRSTVILIGPEGGFDEQEIGMLKRNGYVAARLGAKILRTETAGVAGISALLYHYSS